MARWIKPRKEGIVIFGPGHVECSDCNEKVFIPDKFKFCPYCGKQIENVIVSKDYKYNWLRIQEGLPAE